MADFINDKSITLCVDLYGCPNRCKHCWLGHMPNQKMEDDADAWIVDYFSHTFRKSVFTAGCASRIFVMIMRRGG